MKNGNNNLTEMFTDTHEGIAELIRLVLRKTEGCEGPVPTQIEGLRFSRFSSDTQPTFYFQETAVCFVLQGRKTVMLGQEVYTYDPATCLVASVELPVTGMISGATKDKPYLGIVLNVNPKDLAALIVETGKQHFGRDENNGQALSITPIMSGLSDPLIRLVKLLDVPEEIPVMAPLIIREINFRMLQTEQFHVLSQAAVGDGKLHRVSRAIAWLKQNLATPLRIEDLAQQVNMSASGLHHQFKEVTALSPLQFQKRLRLQKARQMILTDNASAEKIAFSVGYESPSQFNREYTRLFGLPPVRDAKRLRELVLRDDA